MRRKWLGFLPSRKGPKSRALGLPSVPAQAVPSRGPTGHRSPGAPPPPPTPPAPQPAPRPHSLFLRKRSSCSTAMALTQSRAACSSEYNVKAIASRRRPRPDRSFSRRRRGRGAATTSALLREPGRPQTRSPRSSAPIRLGPAPRSRQPGGSPLLSRPGRSSAVASHAWLLKAGNVAGGCWGAVKWERLYTRDFKGLGRKQERQIFR